MTVLKLKEYREKLNMSQRDIAKLLNISQPYYHAWETGAQIPNGKQILSLCDIFMCSPNDLFGWQGTYEVATKDFD